MINTTITNITPDKANALLKLNTNNFRNIDSHRVKKYSRAMQLGFWEENGEPIQIYEDGTLANGQHRLHAIVESGVTLKNIVIVTGIKRTVTTFDDGKTRTIVQKAKAKGYNLNVSEVGAIGLLMNNGENVGKYEGNELMSFYEKLPDFDIVSFATRKGANHPILRNSSAIAGIYCAYLMNKVSLNEIETFAQICNTGLPIDGVCSYAPLCLRRTIQTGVKHENGVVRNNSQYARVVLFEATFKAICDFVDGKTRTKNYGGDNRAKWIITTARRTAGIR